MWEGQDSRGCGRGRRAEDVGGAGEQRMWEGQESRGCGRGRRAEDVGGAGEQRMWEGQESRGCGRGRRAEDVGGAGEQRMWEGQESRGCGRGRRAEDVGGAGEQRMWEGQDSRGCGRGRRARTATCTLLIPKRLATSAGSRKNPSIKTVTRELLEPCADSRERNILCGRRSSLKVWRGGREGWYILQAYLKR